MPKTETDANQSEYNQQAFAGGMNLLSDDTRLQPNQYRVGFNLRNRYDQLDLIPSSAEDVRAPIGIKQKILTFGNFVIAFVSGKAYYRYYTDIDWIQIIGFSMSSTAPRYWTAVIPVATTNYYRVAAATGGVRSPIILNNVSGANSGDLPGLLVQDNINQPQFIFINNDGIPTADITQSYDEWIITFTNVEKTIVDVDAREYVPIGNAMAVVNGILWIAAPDSERLLRSVQGRPLDFVVNVNTDGTKGGDAYSTCYTVGVGGISCLRQMSSNALFVSAGNANFAVTQNTANNAPLEFGEYTFIRTFLFNSNCLSDRVIFDSVGDTKFIDLTGVRSFNAVAQTQTEGRNLPFTAAIKGAFTILSNEGTVIASIMQEANNAAAILFDDYELYACNTIFGPAIAIYDTINSCWVGFDLNQTNGKKIKEFAKIELDIQALYAITEDDKLYHLYSGPGTDPALVRTIGLCANIIYAGSDIKYSNPKYELQARCMRLILNRVTDIGSVTITEYINNRQSSTGPIVKQIKYENPVNPAVGPLALSDVNTELKNLYFPLPNSEHGWKVFATIGWTIGSITQFSAEFNDITPMNPLNSQ